MTIGGPFLASSILLREGHIQRCATLNIDPPGLCSTPAWGMRQRGSPPCGKAREAPLLTPAEQAIAMTRSGFARARVSRWWPLARARRHVGLVTGAGLAAAIGSEDAFSRRASTTNGTATAMAAADATYDVG